MLNDFGEVLFDANLTNYNTYGINTSAKYLIKPNSQELLKELIIYLKKENIKYYILGGGSNVILPDNKFDGTVISLENLKNIEFNGSKVSVEAGINLNNFIMQCVNNSLGGLEHLALIPGTLGGALYGNAGVKDHTIYDYLENITIIRNDEFITLKKEDIKYSYRYTMFKENNDIILSATFNLYEENIEMMKEIIKESRIKRANSQPLEYKNAGSVFKNPEGNYAGKLIEDLDLKGYTLGGAQVSNKHANFIINIGNATSEDIKKLITYIKEKVYEEYKINLELEQIIVEWE